MEEIYSSGVVEILMGFVSRLDEVEVKSDNQKGPQVRPLNPSKNDEAVRKSFIVMEIFLNPMNDLDNLLRQRLPLLCKISPIQLLVKELFKVFQPNSAGNFHHFNKVLEQLLVRAPVETTHTLISDNLLWMMFDHLHESPIVDSVIDVFCCGFPRYLSYLNCRQSDTIQFYKALVDVKIFEKIGDKIYGSGSKTSL